MKKLITIVVIVVIALIVLNRIGWLTPQASEKVVKMQGQIVATIDKASTVKYNGKSIKDYKVEDLSKQVTKDLGDLGSLVQINEDGSVKISDKATAEQKVKIEKFLQDNLKAEEQ